MLLINGVALYSPQEGNDAGLSPMRQEADEERQRAGLACALAVNLIFIMLDEAIAALNVSRARSRP